MSFTEEIESSLIEIPAGKITLGSKEAPSWYPPVEMEISENFLVGKHVITQAQWKAVMGTEPWKLPGVKYRMLGESPIGPDLPAINLTQVEAREFTRRYSALTKKPASLVPEVFWEYACRGSQSTDYYWGDSSDLAPEYEWGDWEGPPTIRVSGQLKPNPYGLFDMCGNVNELVADLIPASESHYVAASHYTKNRDFVSVNGKFTILRSGNVTDVGNSMQCGAKAIIHSEGRQLLAGFRIARIPWLKESI